MMWWLHRLRGLLGLTGFGAIAGLLFGLLWGARGALLGSGAGPMTLPVVFGILGAGTGLTFGILLTTTLAGRSLEDVSATRAAVLCGLAGAVAPMSIAILLAGSLPPLGIAAWFVGVGGALGAALGAGLITAAKSAPGSKDLPSAEPKALID